ncbi:transglycosylase domain-containing protein [Paractinoplanes abujensis]|uniref:Membrane peptidoglycan carboxypeptidase n=1 Tax=Paractinoplanes abujensis TaxID=882441 RepID=A0A7W7CSD6_9ACTN|nr:transglycosylase domain-containing protein [Actinoplanes abujensis]MBB4693794.1 membrane peptidoglycan carboxypeptidase [Actinoplanes abujensis]
MGAAPVGSASVGAAPVGGRASVGSASVARAAVRPKPPGEQSPAGPKDPKATKKAAKKRRRTNLLTVAAAVLVIVLGAGVVGGAYFFDDVKFTEPKSEDQVTQIFAADNKTQIATIGNSTRQQVPYASINPVIGQAVMAAEDKNFLDHNGIDMKGIARAAWNNFTGGDQQGASTITQQYARHAAELKEISYNRKLREAVIARKMEDQYSKGEILGRYLNSVYFGRGAYGIEAAVKAYFGPNRSVLTKPGTKGAITAAEAAVIASVIKQPEPSKTHQGYDPQNNPTDAKIRWQYTINNMLEKGWIKTAPAKYPTVAKFNPDACRTSCGNDKATGKIVKYVKQELRAMGINDARQKSGGLRITTTINPGVQKAAETAAMRTSDKSPLRKLDATYKTALVAVDPTNGHVMAYYGGPDGVGWDYAGPNYNSDGDFIGGGRPPGSSFKIYTLLAALSDGYGFDTTWDSEAKKVGGDAINNSSRTNFSCDKRRCPLDEATIQSYNFPFYHLAAALGPDKVAEAAYKAGIQYISSPTKIGARVDLTKTKGDALKQYGNEIGYGQYAITALDHANGVATLANEGRFTRAHFVKSVAERDEKTGKFKTIHSERVVFNPSFDPGVVAAIDNVLEKIPGKNGQNLRNGYDAIGKSGTWEYKDGKSGQNGDAWWVGATPHLAATVWIGREKQVKDQMQLLPIYKPNSKKGMTGGSTPGDTWKVFMDLANKALDAEKTPFPPDVKVGDPNKKGNGLDPLPEAPTNGCILGGTICPPGTDPNNPGGTVTPPVNGPGNPGTGLPDGGGNGAGNGNGNGNGRNNN